jgi:DNA-binding NarL/FixJ family response regulator
MNVLKGTKEEDCEPSRWRNGTPGENNVPREDAAVGGQVQDLGAFQALIYLDPRALTRDCFGRWLQGSLTEFSVYPLSDPDEIETASIANDDIRAVIINAGPERMSSPAIAHLVSRVGELLPTAPIVVLSDHEDLESIRVAFELGVRGLIPTSLVSTVAVGAVHLVCLGGTFVPTASLLSQGDHRHGSAGEPLIEGFTKRQSQILDCLRRGMANKLIAYELKMCESTVKVHVRNIMKKLNATNRTQVAYMTRGLFEAIGGYNPPQKIAGMAAR